MSEKSIQFAQIGFVYLVAVRLMWIREQLCPRHMPLVTKINGNLTKRWRVKTEKRKWSCTRERSCCSSHRNRSLMGNTEKWTSPLLPRHHRSLNTPALTEIHSATSAQHWRLYSCATFLRAQSNLLDQNSRSKLSCFPQQNFHSKRVNESTQRSAALGAQTGNAFFP